MGTLLVGAVAYDPKVVTIWEGIRRYFREEKGVPIEVVLYLSYEAQVDALLAGRIDIAWNTNLAYVQAEKWSEGRCAPLAMRDTDLVWETKIVALAGGSVRSLDDLRGKTLGLGSRDSGHAAILPVHFLSERGLREGADYTSIRFDTDLGKHGDTGTSEVDVLKAVMEGRADAGAVGSPFWAGVQVKKLVPEGAVVEVWTSPPFHHCMFTTRVGLGKKDAERFTEALLAMRWEDPKHRPILEAEGLKEWVKPRSEGYASLRAAAELQGFFAKR
jgi:ABC-type phosphate/phosphonate transport system substrate-binding protein